MGRMASRIGVGEDVDRTSRSSEGAWLNVVCPTVMSASGEADTIDLGEGVGVIEGRVVLKGSMTGLSEMVGMR